MLTPHLPGSMPALLALNPGMAPAADFRQLQTAWRSGVVFAAALRDLTPEQHDAGTAPPFVRKGMHEARELVTWPQEMAACAVGAVSTTKHSTATTHAELRVAMETTQGMAN